MYTLLDGPIATLIHNTVMLQALVVYNKYKSHLLTAILIIMYILPDGPIATLIHSTITLQVRTFVVYYKYKTHPLLAILIIMYTLPDGPIATGVETASHAGHCPINLVNVW